MTEKIDGPRRLRPLRIARPNEPLQPRAVEKSVDKSAVVVDTSGTFEASVRTATVRKRKASAPPFEALKASLTDAAGQANIKHALRMLSVTTGPAAAAAQAILDDGSHHSAAPAHGVDAIAHAVARLIAIRLDPGTREGVANAARLKLVAALSERRAGSERQRIFALEPVVLPDVLPPPPNLTPRVGFEPGVAGVKLDVEQEHSIDDLQTYIDDRFGRFALEDLVTNQRTIEVHHGAREEAFSSAVARGFTDLTRVRTPEATMQNELYLARNPGTGEVRYLVAEVWGANRMVHLQKLLYTACVDGRRIDSARVEVHTEPMRRPEEIYRRTARALLASGTVPASVVIGFKNSLLRELGSRAAAGKRLEYVQQALGPDPGATLRARAQDAGASGTALTKALDALGPTLDILRAEPSEIFRFSVKQDQLAAVERALVDAVKASPESALLVDDVVGTDGFKVVVGDWVQGRVPEGTFIDQTVITYIDAEGAKRSLLLTKNPYGEVAHELGRVLVDNGVDNVFVFGTAGALDKKAAVGELHAPTQVIKRLGTMPFQNVALDIVTTMPELLRPQLHAGTTVANVRSPVDETIAAVDQMRDAGADLVEMELSHLLRALKGSTVSLAALYMVSDVPGTDKSIEKQANGELSSSLRRAVDVLVEGLGMRGVVVAPEQQPPAPGGFEGAMLLAQRALDKRGIRGEQYGLMRLVVARYLLNGLSDKAIGSLVADDKADALASTRVASRWQEKALRELAHPFTNDDVVERVRYLGAELKDALLEIKKLGGTADNYKVHVLGSLIKGRAAKGSDLDVLIETRDEGLRERVFDSRFGWRGGKPNADVVMGSYDYLVSRGAFYGPVLDIGDGQRFVEDPLALVDVWAKSVAPYGVRVQTAKDGSVRVDADPGALSDVDVARETEAVAERLLEHEKAFRRFVDTDFLLRHLRDVAPLADVVDVPLDRLVRAGEVLLRQRLPAALNRARVLELLATPLGEAKLRAPGGVAFLKAAGIDDRDALIARVERSGIGGLPWALFVDGEVACELMRVGDPFSRLCVDVAAADRAKKGHTGGQPLVFPFFAREVRVAEARERNGSAAALHGRLHGGLHETDAPHAPHPPEVAADAALHAMAAAGVPKGVVDTGPARTVGLGITVPIMDPQPSVDLPAYVNEPSKRDLSKLRIAIAADHGAFGRAEKCAEILQRMGVGEVVVLAPTVPGEKVPYAVTSHAALSMLEDGSVDRVISFCGNGLGALDVANQHAEHDAEHGGTIVKPPVYGDNLWSVVDGQSAGANVLAMGGRLLDVNGDPMAAFLKAFLDDPPSSSSIGGSPVHGVTSRLVDPEPKRIAKRTLSQPIKDAAKLSPDELRRAVASPVAVYFNPDDKSARDQVKTLRQLLAGAGRTAPPNVRFIAWDGAQIPKAAPGERVLLLSDTGCPAVPTRAWGSFQPEQLAVHRAAYVNGVASFARGGGAILDLPCASLRDAATGGRQNDLLRLFVKTFLLESSESSGPREQPQKALYGESVRFTEAMLQGGALPPDLASWGDKLAEVLRGARRL